MKCSEFLDRHSEFRDGLITAPRELRRFSRHLAHCVTCRRYDETVREGVHALNAATHIAPSPQFRERLEARLAAERRNIRPIPARAGISAALLVAAALSLLVMEVGRRPVIARAPELPPVAFPKPVVNPGLPVVSFQDPRASVVSGNPSPYGTALVQPASASR
jgi:hypothetical protein